MPLLIYNFSRRDRHYYSAIDILNKNKAYSLILSICSRALSQDVTTGLMYDEVTRYLEALSFNKNLVRSYLGSQICFRSVPTELFEEKQENVSEVLHACSEYETIVELIKDFKNVEE